MVEFAVGLTRRYPLRGYDAVHLATAVTLNNALLGADLATLSYLHIGESMRETLLAVQKFLLLL